MHSSFFVITIADDSEMTLRIPLSSSPYALNATHGGGIAPHEWDGTSLGLQNPNGTWGAYLDLHEPTASAR